MPSDKRLLTDALLSGGLDDLIIEGRRNGWSWDVIARTIWIRTDSKVYVTAQTVRTWGNELVA